MVPFCTWKIRRHGGEIFIHGSQWFKLTTGNQTNRFKVVHIPTIKHYMLPDPNGRRKLENYRNNVVLEHPDQNNILYQRKKSLFPLSNRYLWKSRLIKWSSHCPIPPPIPLKWRWVELALLIHGSNERQQRTRSKWKQLERVSLGPYHLLCIMYQLNCALLPTG